MQKRNANELAPEVIGFHLEHEVRFLEAAKLGLEWLDRGEYVSHEEVGARINPPVSFLNAGSLVTRGC